MSIAPLPRSNSFDVWAWRQDLTERVAALEEERDRLLTEVGLLRTALLAAAAALGAPSSHDLVARTSDR